MNKRTIFNLALIAHILCPLGVSIINFKINFKVFIFFKFNLGISFENFAFGSAISFQSTILNWAFLLTNNIPEETFPVTNVMSLDFLSRILKLENAWVLNVWFQTFLQCLLASNLLLFDS